MSKISRIRILNLNYNNNTIKIDDETFDLGGQNTLISLRNGGGKSVLVQMIVSLFVNRTYRDFGDRPFKSYFTTNRPTFLMTEWILDNGIDRFLAGMMVRKNQKEDNDTEELEMYTFTGSYSNGCKYDLDNLPIIRQDGNKKILKGFGECKNLLEEISRNEPGDFRLYDMASQYGRRQYFSTLRQYQINNKEWESIIGNCDTLLFLGGGNEPTSLEFVVKLLGKETLATRTRGQTKGRNGSSSTNFQQTGRELMTLDEVRKLGTNQAILFIRGESPVLDEKYNIKNHPNIRLTVDGKAKPYVHKPQGAPNYALPDLPYEFKSLDDYEFINMEESEHEETEKEDDAES